ncbi:MAG: hypothetical protein RBT55_01075 [Rhodocyclaceae bacterium]|nr:hypothetical protein [Rhodocyclaceae bacterium]
MRNGLARQRLTAVFLFAVLLFNYPLLSLFDRGEFVFGMPVLFLFLFIVWAAVIAAVALIAERRRS